MKLHNKILAFAAPTALISTITPVALTSCDGKTAVNTITLVTKQNEWVDPTDGLITIELKLAKELTDEYQITGPTFPADSKMQFHNAQFKSGGSTINVVGTKVTVTTGFEHSSDDAFVYLQTVNYTIIKKDTQEPISKATITDFKVSWTA